MVVEEEREAAAMLVACERQKARQANVSLFLEQVEGDARDRLRAVSEVYAVKFRQMAAEEATRQEEARLEAEALNGAAVSIQKVERGRTGAPLQLGDIAKWRHRVPPTWNPLGCRSTRWNRRRNTPKKTWVVRRPMPRRRERKWQLARDMLTAPWSRRGQGAVGAR